MFKVLVVGCGQLGSRHLQAISTLEGVDGIDVLDSNSESLALGQARMREIQANALIKFSWLNSINQTHAAYDLCIVATHATGRVGLIKEIVLKTKCAKFLVEKIVAQSTLEYEQLLELSRKNNLKIWVNCQTRTYEIYKRIKSLLNPAEPIYFSVFGGNHGLACNGIHAIDLFLFLDGSNDVESMGSIIDEKFHPSKRGKDLYDLSGTLMAASPKGSQCVVHFSAEGMSPDNAIVLSRDHKFVIDQMKLKFFESHADENWLWREHELKENLFVSHMSRKFAQDILTKDVCDLPTLEQAWPSHQYLLNELLPHFNRLLKSKMALCPVT